jgi:hypothetical protein
MAGQPPVFRAIWENSLSAVRRIILQDPGVLSQKDNDNDEPLHLAAYLGHPAIVKELVLSGASIDATEQQGNTALMLAIAEGHSDTTSVLLQHGADVQIYNDQGFTALKMAAELGYSEICDLLLRHGSQVDERMAGRITGQKGKRGPSTESCALIMAASKGHFTTVRTLIAWGATIDIQDYDGWTPLFFASQEGRVASVLSLLQAGASTTLCTRQGVPAVYYAAQQNMAAILHIFFSHGCSPDLVSIIISIISYHIYIYTVQWITFILLSVFLHILSRGFHYSILDTYIHASYLRCYPICQCKQLSGLKISYLLYLPPFYFFFQIFCIYIKLIAQICLVTNIPSFVILCTEYLHLCLSVCL